MIKMKKKALNCMEKILKKNKNKNKTNFIKSEMNTYIVISKQ